MAFGIGDKVEIKSSGRIGTIVHIEDGYIEIKDANGAEYSVRSMSALTTPPPPKQYTTQRPVSKSPMPPLTHIQQIVTLPYPRGIMPKEGESEIIDGVEFGSNTVFLAALLANNTQHMTTQVKMERGGTIDGDGSIPNWADYTDEQKLMWITVFHGSNASIVARRRSGELSVIKLEFLTTYRLGAGFII